MLPQGPLATVFSHDQKATAQVYLVARLHAGAVVDVNGRIGAGPDSFAYAEHLLKSARLAVLCSHFWPRPIPYSTSLTPPDL